MNTKNVAIAIIVAAIVVVAGVTAYELSKGNGGGNPSNVTITEAGSSLLYPLFNVWAGNYTNATFQPAAGGSGLGISEAISGTVNLGGSDAYLSSSVANAHPYVINVPILLSYQYITYNIPGLNNVTLNLSGNIIAGIYNGNITKWNNAAIVSANPGVSLPDKTIVPVHRSDGSGDTFMFTSFLSKANDTWNTSVGASTNPNWPSNPAAATGNGNTGVIATEKSTPYSTAYVAATYSSTVASDGFGIAKLKNKDGNYVTANVTNVKEAASQYLSQIPSSGSIALQYAPGASAYPIADMEYVIVKLNQTSQSMATALQDLIKWMVSPTGGSQSKYLDQFNLAPLPSSVVNGVVLPLVSKIATSSSGSVTITEAGSSLLYPVFNAWAGNYTAANFQPAAGGSGLGISEAISGTVNLGGSDAYMSSSLAKANPSVMNIPILISYQYITYNVPGLGVSNLNLSASMIAGMYNGSIQYWDNSAISAANPGATLPHQAIVPVHRSDGSGDTFMFTSFLSKANSWWGSNVGASTNPNWPSNPAAATGNGNTGMIATEKSTPYSIAYIAATYTSTIQSDGFGIAHLLNQAGNYVTANVTNVAAAAAQYLPDIPANGTIALQFAPGANSYPIADLEYVIVQQNQSGSLAASALQALLSWMVSSNGGSSTSYLNTFYLAPLPAAVVNNVTTPLINKIKG